MVVFLRSCKGIFVKFAVVVTGQMKFLLCFGYDEDFDHSYICIL